MIPTIYILLPVHNRKQVTEKFINCLVAQTYSNYHLLLIDDGSTDGTEEMVKGKVEKLTILTGSGNWWWAGSLQKGLQWLSEHKIDNHDIVVFANNDITFNVDFVQKAVTLLETLDATLLLPQVLNEFTDIPEESGIEANMRKLIFKSASSSDKINCMPTRGLFMRMSDLRIVGGFYPRLLPHYWSDYEFTMRAYSKGLRLFSCANFTISFDRTQTGYHGFKDADFLKFLKQYFSKKSVLNPVYKSAFVILVSPKLYIPISILRVWRSASIYILKQFKRSIKFKLNKMSVVNAIHSSQNDLKIIIGADITNQDGWISTNYQLLDITDQASFAAILKTESVSNFLAEHVWEHLSVEDGCSACRNCFTFLKQGGVLRIAVPDGFHVNSEYISQVKPGGSGSGADDHKVLYNYKTLSAMLEKAGYKIRLLEWFDEQGNFHFESWNNQDGYISRSTRFDPRNQINPISYTSLIIDAFKP